MDFKAQPRSREIGATRSPAISEPPHALSVGNMSYESVAASREMVRHGDAARLLEITSEAERPSRRKFEEMMFRLSKTFINLPVDRVDSELSNGLKALAEALDLDRVSINMFSPDKISKTITHSWARPGIPAAPLGKITELFPWEANLIAKHEVCCVSTPEDLPAQAVAERSYMLAEGLKSWLTIPLQVGGEQLGGMGTSMFRREQIWDSLSISRFQQAGELFASVLARRRAAEAQSESEERFRTVANTAPVLIWMYGTDKLCTFFNQGWLAFTGHTMEEESGNGWASGIHPEDLDRCLATYAAKFDARSEFILEYRKRRHDGEYRWIADRGVPRFESGGRFLGYIGSCIDVTERKLSEQAVAEQLRFETLLAELSATFINLLAGHVRGHLEGAQKRICKALGLDRSTLIQVRTESNIEIVAYSWAAEGVDRSQRLSLEDLPWIARTVLVGGQIVSFARISDLPEEAAKDKESLRQYGLKSNITFPLSAGEKVIGALTFGTSREERDWPASLVDRLGLMAQVFANALARAEADENLHQAYSEIEELKHRLEKENSYLREEVKLEHHHREVIGKSEGIRRVLKKAEQVAATEATVLLLGETGTGKELIARTIHEHSRRKARVMVKVNCAALPASLIESELFGREKGAYTGALTREIGRFELANGSTILLDEIAELPMELQSKLLRVLQEGEFERLGSPRTIKVDVRVIASTSRNLQEAVREGKFREDLFYRLNVFPITIPPLRERREDIPPLVWHFVNDLSQRMGRSIETIQGQTMETFKRYYWPGNVRELRNMIERFLITSADTVFRAKLPNVEAALAIGHTQTFEEVERHHILHIMELVGWRVRGEGGAAQLLGLKPTTLESRMRKLGIVRRK